MVPARVARAADCSPHPPAGGPPICPNPYCRRLARGARDGRRRCRPSPRGARGAGRRPGTVGAAFGACRARRACATCGITGNGMAAPGAPHSAPPRLTLPCAPHYRNRIFLPRSCSQVLTSSRVCREFRAGRRRQNQPESPHFQIWWFCARPDGHSTDEVHDTASPLPDG